jgi:hypothetical protein
VLEYQRLDTKLTLEEGLREYYASRDGLVGGRGTSATAREFFRCHDAAHVVFACDTTLRDEAIVKVWSAFGTTAGPRLLRFYRLPESQEVYEQIQWSDVLRTAIRSVGVVPRVLWRCLRMRKRWPWSEFEAYLGVPLVEIRREHGVRPLAPDADDSVRRPTAATADGGGVER